MPNLDSHSLVIFHVYVGPASFCFLNGKFRQWSELSKKLQFHIFKIKTNEACSQIFVHKRMCRDQARWPVVVTYRLLARPRGEWFRPFPGTLQPHVRPASITACVLFSLALAWLIIRQLLEGAMLHTLNHASIQGPCRLNSVIKKKRKEIFCLIDFLKKSIMLL